MKKKIDPLKRRWQKLRSAIRNVWQYDYVRKAVIQGARQIDPELGAVFECPLCRRRWPLDLATADHFPPLGGFDSWDSFFPWVRNCFEGPQRAICKPCHKKVTASQRKRVA